MHDVEVARNAVVKRAIVNKNVHIGEGVEIGVDPGRTATASTCLTAVSSSSRRACGSTHESYDSRFALAYFGENSPGGSLSRRERKWGVVIVA